MATRCLCFAREFELGVTLCPPTDILGQINTLLFPLPGLLHNPLLVHSHVTKPATPCVNPTTSESWLCEPATDGGGVSFELVAGVARVVRDRHAGIKSEQTHQFIGTIQRKTPETRDVREENIRNNECCRAALAASESVLLLVCRRLC